MALSKQQLHGRRAEKTLCELLRRSGRKAEQQDFRHPFDMLVDGWRVEVKTATPRNKEGRLTWSFNIHRHGKLKERCDFYVMRMEKLPRMVKRSSVYLLYRAPIGRLTVDVTLGCLLNGEMYRVVDYTRFREGEYGSGPGVQSNG